MNFQDQVRMAFAPKQEEPRPFVQFEMRAVEDRAAASPDGVTHMVDKAWAIIRAPGSKDSLEKLASEWLDQLTQYARDGRIPASWPADYREAFRLWQAGEEIPVMGTAIKLWSPLSPAQRKNLLSLGVLTVEQLSTANEEILGRLGMGGHTLKALANTWLTEAKDKGSMAQSLEAAMTRLAAAENTIKEQAAQIAVLTKK